MTDSRDNLLEQLSAYLDGELSAEDVLAVEASVANDPTLAEELDAMRQMREVLGSIPEEDAPPYLSDRILARMNRKVDARLSRRPLRSARWITYAAAAVVLITVGITYVAFLQSMTGSGEVGNLASEDTREDDRIETDEGASRPRTSDETLDDADSPLDTHFNVIEGVPGEELEPGELSYSEEHDTAIVDGGREDDRIALEESAIQPDAEVGSFDRAIDQFEEAMGRNRVEIRRTRRVGDTIEYDVVTDVTTAHRVMDEFQDAQAAEPDPAAILAQAGTGFGYADADDAGNRAPNAGGGSWTSSEGNLGADMASTADEGPEAQLPIQSQTESVARDINWNEVEPFYYRQVALAPRGDKGVNAVELPSQYLADADLEDSPDTLPDGMMTNAMFETPEEQEVIRLHEQSKEMEATLVELDAREDELRRAEEMLTNKLDELEMLSAKISTERASVEAAKARAELQDVRKELVVIEAERMELEESLRTSVASVAETDGTVWEDDGGMDRRSSDDAFVAADGDESVASTPPAPTTEVVADVTKRGGDASRDDATTPRTMRFVLKQISPETVANYQQFAQRFRETEEIDVYIIDDVELVERADALEGEVAAEASEAIEVDEHMLRLESAEPATTPESGGEPAGD